ncbi:TNT domain-containing protein [Streptomyces thermoalcalitolerans]|uniref:TNT domain-containing protein n=1 Tax=Streptomyces thermoalcalitolerans TaxID=65605 RepID=A0ABP4A016_9ACTN
MAAIGLAGSLVMGASVSSATPVAEGGGQASTHGHDRSHPSALRQAGPLGRPGDGHDDPETSRVCKGLVPYPIPAAYRPFYFCGDWRLGPKRLPQRGLVADILRDYHRLGNLTAVQFLNTWWDPAEDAGQGNWKYPPFDGFALNSNQQPIAAPLVLHAGQLVDRFGNENGRFLAPAGTKFGQRSIPPSNLNTEDPRYPYNYHLYRVTRDVTVCAGPAAAAFEQPGGGIQYATSSTAACPTLPFANVSALVANGTLVRVKVPYTESKPMKQKPPAGVRAASR